MRGAGGCGGPVTTGGAAERVAPTGTCGVAEAVIDGALDAGGAITAAGGAGRGGAATGGALAATVGAVVVTEAAGFSATGTTPTGRAGAVGTAATGADGGAVGRASGGTATGFATIGGAAGRAGGAAASFFCVMAFSTSPGREMFDRSILVLISSSPRSGRADFAVDDAASDEPRRWILTFSAS
jgi:hypothetical protein